MLSGALAGLLKVVAVGLTAAGLSASVYFLVQASDNEDAARRAQSPVTPASSSEPLSPPQVALPTQTPSAPTPTFPPADITPPPDIDTSDWKTYESPEGFSLRYPSDWTVLSGPPNFRVVSPEAARAIAQEEVDRNTPGMAEVAVWFDKGSLDVDAILQDCERPDELSLEGESPDAGSVVTFLGRRAVRCVQSGIEVEGEPSRSAQWFGVTYFIELSPGRVITASGYVVPNGAVKFDLLEAIIGSLSLEETQ